MFFIYVYLNEAKRDKIQLVMTNTEREIAWTKTEFYILITNSKNDSLN